MPAPDHRSPEPTAGRRGSRRITPQQRALLEVMRRDDRFRSAQQLHADLRATPTLSAGLTSVYRILRILTDQQVVEVQRAEDGEFLYRLRDNDRHHHHLLCRICGRAEEFTLDDLEHHTDRIAGQHRYADVTHHIDLYGTCPECLGGQNDQEPEKYVE